MVSVMTVANTQSTSTTAKFLEYDAVRPSVSASEAFSMVPSIDTRLADAQKGDASPYSTPRSTDAGDSVASPSCRSGSFGDCSASDSVLTDGGSSSETDSSSVSSRRQTQRNLFGTVVTVCAAVLPFTEDAPQANKQQAGGQKAVLTASPTSWAAQQRLRRQQKSNGEADVVRSVRSLLNKLTPERFDAIYEQIVASVQSPTAVTVLVREVFEKATTQHNFIGMYVDLCVGLESDARMTPTSGKAADTFRRILLGQCQSSFEDMLEAESMPASDEGLDEEAREEQRMIRKQKALGNMKLIGQLLTRGMLSSKLLVNCCQDLLSEQQSVPDALEFLAALLTVAGPTFDQVQGWSLKPHLDAVFAEIRRLMRSGDVPARVRFLLRDLLDLQVSNWKDTKKATAGKDGPKRLEEVRGQQPSSPSQSNNSYRTQEWQQPAQKPRPTRRGGKKTRSDSGVGSPSESDKKGQAPVAVDSPALSSSSTSASDLAAPASRAAVAAEAPLPKRTGPFDRIAFSREVHATLKELGTSHNVAAAVRRIRAQDVPVDMQATEFGDMLARAAEESRGPVRRYAFAFIAGLANGEQSAFDKAACLQGIKAFFLEDYESLCEEVPKLGAIVASELVPTLRSVFSAAQLEGAAVPRSCLR